ncbi:hypothetical protein CIG75_01120 [Tumebacillus algifaecis]|uniref:DUF3817 domain-containing protein n=1 Tax=Tumebacillus algifaecis TaxID=1214604 RepID=A0A223CX23_9BACL|nr:DUF3817 domain-containing protein [Tumebacillus algifaecis]ASS73714.1 hypothetical protein CIG75_01120 [Tumebacillus algifaecis]
MNMKTAVGRLRAIGLIEGISFLLLLLIAMPMKYLMDIPGPVQVVGMIHGVLFMLFILAVINAAIVHKWSPKWIIGALIASSVPIGTFVLDAKLKKRYQE